MSSYASIPSSEEAGNGEVFERERGKATWEQEVEMCVERERERER